MATQSSQKAGRERRLRGEAVAGAVGNAMGCCNMKDARLGGHN